MNSITNIAHPSYAQGGGFSPPIAVGGELLAASNLARPWSVFGNGIESAPRPQFSMVSMFSGCGGMDLGLRFAGFDILWANDKDADACETYRQNLGGQVKDGDIRKINFPKLGNSGVHLLAACFPCQPFSNAGTRKGTQAEDGKLNAYALRGVDHFRPAIVIYENVRGMLTVRDGKKLLVEKICRELVRRGYDVRFRLIDASDHMVPQRRFRLFIVGVDRKKVKGEFVFPRRTEGEKESLTLKNIILDVRKNAFNAQDALSLGKQAQRLCELIPEGGSWKSITDGRKLPRRLQRIRREKLIYRQPNFYRRFGLNELAGTITAAFKPENCGVLHPRENRAFSVREAARIQSFPDWFQFFGKSSASKCRQVGNAVPPRLAYELGLAIVATLCKRTPDNPNDFIDFADFLSKQRPLRPSDADVFIAAASKLKGA